MAQYRTAQGKVLDMGMFASQNERVRAVGNMRVNARGDTIDSEGRVVQSVNDKINDYYSDTVTTPGATTVTGGQWMSSPASKQVESKKPVVSSTQPVTPPPRPQPTELSAEEMELERSLEESLEEEIKVEKTKGRK